ncbi:MAG: hypothetical protein GF393_08895 [Armatimonadia bacterium]|nr:hypothetical protein [Armatimonadia bacterium]
MNALRRIAEHRWTLLVVALAIGVVGAWGAFESGLTPPDVREQRPDEFDVDMLKKGLDRTPHFSDTFRWFTGEWIGCNPFWRPLSSYVFWTLHRTIGWEPHDDYEVVRGACHVIVTGMAFWLVAVITGRPLIGLIAVALANLTMPVVPLSLLWEAYGADPVRRWISMPDMWVAMVTLPALWLAWQGRIWWAVPLVAAAAMLKETGFVVFPLVMLVYWWRYRRLHPAFSALIVIAGIFATLKLVYVGPGWILGSNRSIWVRMARFALPRPVNYMLTGGAPWATMGIGLGAAIILWRRQWTALGVLAGMFVLSILAYRYTIGIPIGNPGMDVALAGLLDRQLFRMTPQIAIWTLAAWAGLRGPYRREVILLAIAHLVMGLPGTIAPQTGTRSFYTALLFSSSVSAVCAWSIPAIFGISVKAPAECDS